MDRKTAYKLERYFYNLPKNVVARRAFCCALQAVGCRFIYLDKSNGDKTNAFRVFADEADEI